MCGISGIIDRTDRPVSEEALVRLRDSITHRGPDDAGLYQTKGVGLGSRRLAIIDLSPGGPSSSIRLIADFEETTDLPELVDEGHCDQHSYRSWIVKLAETPEQQLHHGRYREHE